MSGIRDPWVLLGVERNATDAEIKKAYRNLVLEYHPDRNRDADNPDELASRFQDIARAYEAISSEDNRVQWLADNEDPFADEFNDASNFPDLDQEIAEDVADSHPGIVQETLTIDFKQAFEGLQTEVNIEMEDMCQVCGGSGAAPGHKPRPCELCQGTGRHKVGRLSNKCSGCDGRGFVVEVPCPACREGKIREKRPFVFKIPPGVPDGYRMSISGHRRGQIHSPDIMLTIEVEPSPIFRRERSDTADLQIEVPISYSEAVMGSSVKIPTPTKVIALKIPPGTPSGKQFRVSGQGMPRLEMPDARGDLYAMVQVAVPTSISEEQLRLIQALGQYDPDDIRYKLFNPMSSQ